MYCINMEVRYNWLWQETESCITYMYYINVEVCYDWLWQETGSYNTYILNQHSWWARAVVGNKLLHPIRCRPNAGPSGGGGPTRTVARDVNVCSQVSSPANEHQMAAALPRNTTQAADSATFSWLISVKQQQAAQWSHHSCSRHLAALPNCLAVQHKIFCSTTFNLATYSASTWCMPYGRSFLHSSKSCLNVWIKGLKRKKLYTCKSSKICDWDYLEPPSIPESF